jgi:hypothetical protein
MNFARWIPWAIAEQAYKAYVADGHGSQSLERVAERGGFCPFEIDALLAGNYRKTGKLAGEDFYRAGGTVICDRCGLEYWRHPYSPHYPADDGRAFLNRLCNGDLVKL